MAQVALTQKPFEVAVAKIADSFTAQRGALVAVAPRVGLMALLAVVAIDERAGGGCIRLAAKRIGAGMIPGRNVLPVRSGCRAESNRRGESD